MPAESARLRRRVERHDLRLLAAAGVLGVAAVPLGLAFRGSPHHAPGCVSVSRAGFMGNQTETSCSVRTEAPNESAPPLMVGVASERLNRRTPMGVNRTAR